jgi:REP element-mobilizing transposase RayT
MFRGLERRRIFFDDYDRNALLQRLGALIRASDCEILAWTLLPNHAHLLLRSGQSVGLSDLMHRLLGAYAGSFNRRHHRHGHLFQGRFKSVLVEEEPYLLELIRYIHLNLVRARLVGDIAALDRCPWTGHARLVGTYAAEWQSVDCVLELFGIRVGQARRSYRQFVLDGWAQGYRPDLAGGGLRRSRTGWQLRGEIDRGRERWASDERILGSADFVRSALARIENEAAPSLEAGAPVPAQIVDRLVARLAPLWDVSPEAVASSTKQRDPVAARAAVSYAAVVGSKISLTTVARLLRVSPSSVLRGVRRGRREIERRAIRLADLLA